MSGQQHLSLHRLSLRPAHTGTNGSSDEAGTDVDADVLGPDELLRAAGTMARGDAGGFVRLLDTDFIKGVVRMAIGPASLYTGTVAMPRGKYFDILTEFLRLSTEGAAEAKDAKEVEIIKKLSTVATHMLAHTSELLALYKATLAHDIKQPIVRFMSAAAHHESLLNAIIDTNGFLGAMANDFRSNSDYSADLCEVFVAIAKQRPKLLNENVFSVDIYNALLDKIDRREEWSRNKDMYFRLLTHFWKENAERVEAFRSTTNFSEMSDMLAAYASRVEDEEHALVLKHLAANGGGWRYLSRAARDATNDTRNRSKIADALKDPVVLLGAATSERPEPLAAYMLMTLRELDAEKDGANATWWKEAWEKLDKAFEGDVMHGELIANMLHAPLRGFMYKETEKRFEVGKEKNDSDPADERQKRPRTGIGQFRTLLELTRARLLDHP
tara:strand:+ start:61 stop:1386 length:1326 start_codon:yes stop_codon:yes gene_type:complete